MELNTALPGKTGGRYRVRTQVRHAGAENLRGDDRAAIGPTRSVRLAGAP